MRIELEVPDYTPERGLRLAWEEGAEVELRVAEEVVLRANRAGLVSLARHLLTLAQEAVPPDSHLHLDAESGLESGSAPLILERA